MTLVLANTLTQNYRELYKGNIDKNEARSSQFGAMDAFRRQTDDPMGILDASDKALIAQSFGNTVQLPVLNFENIVIGNARTCAFQSGGATSALLNLTAITYSFGFDMIPSQHFNNDVKFQAAFNRNLRQREIALAKAIDAQCVAVLEAQKNQVFGADITAYYPAVGDALQVPQADKNDFYNQLQSILQTQDFDENTDVVTNHNNMPLVRRLLNQGAGNDENDQFQLPPYSFYPTNRVANGVGVESTLYAIQPGTLAMVPLLDPDCLLGHSVGDVKEWGQMMLPLTGLNVGTFFQSDCFDASGVQGGAGVAGLTRVKQMSFEWSVDIVFATAYNSDIATRSNPILKVEILS